MIFGTGSFAECAHFYFTEDSDHEVVAFTVDGSHVDREELMGLPVVAFESVHEEYAPGEHSMFVAVGYAGVNRLRAQTCERAKEKGFELVSYVSSKATTWPGLEVGDNCFIFEDNTIQPFSRIGNDVVMWSGNHIGHHARLAANCFITSHVVISGGVQVGANAFIGVNSTIRDHVVIGARSVIGAGSLVLEDVPDDGVVAARGSELSKVPSHRLRHL